MHLAQEHVDALFEGGYALTHRVDLSQPRQYACEERMNLVGPWRRVEKDRDICMVCVEAERTLIYGAVLVRVNTDYRLAMHIDTDEANAVNLRTGMLG